MALVGPAGLQNGSEPRTRLSLGDAEWLRRQAAGDWRDAPATSGSHGTWVGWRSLFVDGVPEPAWLVEPVLPAWRMTALVAGAKTGKSLLALDLALNLAAGREVFARPAGKAVRVLYVDYEMTEHDLLERVVAMGYGPSDASSLSGLHYLLAPTVEPLNFKTGAAQLLECVSAIRPELVIIDTLSRAVAGDENSSEPFREAYRLAWAPLKRMGVAVLRLDHSGHESSNRGRGSSAKRDDVDLSWSLKRVGSSEKRLVLAHHGTSRLGWVPERVELIREIEPRTTHRLAVRGAPPEGAEEWAQILGESAAPVELGERKVREWLKEYGDLQRYGKAKPPRSEVLRAALQLCGGDAAPRDDAPRSAGTLGP